MSTSSVVQLSVVIPVYGSAETLRPLTERLIAALTAIGLPFEVIFVNDGSPDDSWAILCDLQRVHSECVIAIELMRNYGQHNAVMCGFRHARGDFIVTLDDDLQNPPEEIPKLLNAIRDGAYDLVYGVYESKKHRAWQNLGSEVIQAFYRMVFKTSARISSFRVIRRCLLESTFSYSLNFTFIDGLLAWNTQRVGQVRVSHEPRKQGRSGYSLSRLLLHATNIFTNFSLLPLQLVSGVGVLAALGGFACAVYYLFRFLLVGIGVPGYASIIIAVLVLGGGQLLSLGIIGEYLGRLHLNVNRKPQYIERKVLARADSAVKNGTNAIILPSAGTIPDGHRVERDIASVELRETVISERE